MTSRSKTSSWLECQQLENVRELQMSTTSIFQQEREFEQTLESLRRQFNAVNHSRSTDAIEQAHVQQEALGRQHKEQQRQQNKLAKQFTTPSVKTYIPVVPSTRQEEKLPVKSLSQDELSTQDVISASSVIVINDSASDVLEVGYRQPLTSPWYGFSLSPDSSYTIPLPAGQWEVAAYGEGEIKFDAVFTIAAGWPQYIIRID